MSPDTVSTFFYVETSSSRPILATSQLIQFFLLDSKKLL